MDTFLVTERADMEARGWAELDFVLISGDAYVDHPSFAPAVIGRYLESKGYRVGIIAQPDWNDVNAFKKLGKPRLASLVTAGNLDSMLNKFTAAKKSAVKMITHREVRQDIAPIERPWYTLTA